jgi:glycosyltransferase involved in cell wall biosynthesis
MRVHVVDPSAYAPPYDHELCAALARAGADVELITSRFGYGPAPAPDGYALRHAFYRRAAGAAGSRRRLAAKLVQHVPDMLRYRRDARRADVVHLQWLPIEALDVALRPTGRPLVFTAHRPMPTDGRPTQDWGRRRIYERADAVVVHTEAARARLTGELGVDPAKVQRIPHGVFEHLAAQRDERPLPAELAGVEGPVVLYLGVWRPEHGIDVLLRAWEGVGGAELWVVGLPKMDPAPLRRMAPPGVRFLERFVTDPELPAFFRRADLVVLPYHRVEASGVLFTALAFGRPVLATAVGGFLDFVRDGTVAAVPPGDPAALRDALVRLVGDPPERERLAAAARAAAAGPYSWDAIARQTLGLYERLLAGR